MRSPGRPSDAAGAAKAAGVVLAGVVVALSVCACAGTQSPRTDSTVPRSLLAQARPIGRGPRFHPGVAGPVPGACRRRLGRRFGVHVEVFAANRVVLLPAGIGVRGPERLIDGRLTAARCYGALVTVDPTGVVLVRAGDRARLAELFRAWGEPLSSEDLAGFRSRPGRHVSAYADGRRWTGPLASIPLSRHAEIVLEVGPHVPPHLTYTFPRGV